MSKPSIVMSDGWGDGSSRMVLVPRRRVPEGRRRMIVPLIVAAGPPAETIVPAMAKAEGLGVNLWPATVYASSGVPDNVGRSTVELPMASSPDRPRLSIVPLIVTAGAC